MENNKVSVSLTTVIIVTVIIVALLFALIFVIYNNAKTENASLVADNNQQNELVLAENTSDEEVEIENTSQNSNDTEDSSNNVSTQKSVTGKTSSSQSPLSIGEWGIASKRISGDYVDVPVSVTNVTRGTSAAQEVEEYCETGSSIYKYEDADDNMEWAVIEYKVDLTQIDENTSIALNTNITGTGDNASIKYNGYTYIISTMNMSSSSYAKGEIVTCKFAAQLPIGCTDYLIVLGNSSYTQSYFSGI